MSEERTPVMAGYENDRLEVGDIPRGMDVSFSPDGIRLTADRDTEWTGQGDEYSLEVRYFAPAPDVDGFREGAGHTVTDTGIHTFTEGERGGTDEYGRRYCLCRYPVAERAGGTWVCKGTAETPAEWVHTVEWYRGGEPLGSDTVHITLNEAA